MNQTQNFNHNDLNKDKTALGTKSIDYLMMDFMKIYEVSTNSNKISL